MEKICFPSTPPEKVFISLPKSCTQAHVLLLHLALERKKKKKRKKKLFICRAGSRADQPPDSGASNAGPGAPGVSGQRWAAEDAWKRYRRAVLGHSILILTLPLLRGGCAGAPATPRPGACSTRDAPHSPPKRVPEESRDRGSGREGEGRDIGFLRSTGAAEATCCTR